MRGPQEKLEMTEHATLAIARPLPAAVKAHVVVADKNPIVRAGLVDIIRRDGRFDVVDTVSTGNAFIAMCLERHIDIGVIGWSLPDMTGGDVLETLKRRQSPTRVIVYTGEPACDVLRQTIKAGAWGFISKSDEPPVLLETISSVSHGRLCFPYLDMETLSKDPLDVLTTRERELLAALAHGWSNLQIAARIGISQNTVKYHLKNLYDKLGVNNRAMAVALFMSKPGTR
jgi:DNA-binding NarL/FixJ family response regulator